MKKSILFLVLSVVAVAAVFCTSACTGQKPVLHLYNWGDYIDPEVVKAFESEFGCEVKLDTYDSNEAMYAKLKAGAAGYDIVVPSSYMAATMHQQGMLAELDLAKLPNVTANIDRSYLKYSLDPEMKFSVPYFASFTGIGYNKEKVKDFKPTWHMFERDDLKNRCSLLDDQREALGAAMATLGRNVNSTDPKDIEEAVALVLKWKKNIAKFEVDAAKQALATGEFHLIQTYSGDMLQVMSEKPEIAFVIPEEGSTFTFDNLAVLKDSKNPDLALKFINFIYRPDICARNMNYAMYITPNTAAIRQVDEGLRDNPAFNIPEDIRKKCTMLQDLGEKNAVFNKAWESIKQNDVK